MPVKRRRRPKKSPDLRVVRPRKAPQPSEVVVLRHLALLRRYRDVESFCAFVWPEEVRIAYSVIDGHYARLARGRLQARYHDLDALLKEES